MSAATSSSGRIAIFGWLAFLCLRTRLFLAPTWFDGTLEHNHVLLLAGQYTNNEQSRPLQYLLPEALHAALGLSVPHAYAVTHFALLWLALGAFYRAARRWNGEAGALACVALLAAALPFSYTDNLQESAPGLLLCVALGVWAVAEQRGGALAAVVGLGALNNESVLALPALWALARGLERGRAGWGRAIGEAALIGLPGLLVQGVLRAFTRGRPHLTDPYQLANNLADLRGSLGTHPADWFVAEALHPLFLLGPLFALALRGWRGRPLVQRALVCWAPLYILPNLITGIVSELRLFMPVVLVLLPVATWTPATEGRSS